jgi:hypothetical protein
MEYVPWISCILKCSTAEERGATVLAAGDRRSGGLWRGVGLGGGWRRRRRRGRHEKDEKRKTKFETRNLKCGKQIAKSGHNGLCSYFTAGRKRQGTKRKRGDCEEKRDSSTAWADIIAGAMMKKKASAHFARNDSWVPRGLSFRRLFPFR